MSLSVREMLLGEVGLVIDYFHSATAEHLETLGVDPTRLPSRTQWKQLYEVDFAQPIEMRRGLLVLWQLEGKPFGFSTVDKIEYGKQAFMHLHVIDPNNRNGGHGEACVRKSAEIYFSLLKLEQLYCEPNAFNVAPNRTLQKAGFRYVKTHKTVPGPLNYHQAVTQWVLPKSKLGAVAP
jgi:RimJ/RimL family protein N-acetyltransferase